MIWKSNGIEGNGQKPIVLDVVKENGPHRLLIFGTARCLWEDRDKAHALLKGKTHHVMCINDAAIHVMGHPINHIVSLHAEFPGALRKIQMAARNLGQSQTHSDKPNGGIDIVWNFYNVGGTSALFGAKIGIAMGYKKIILCGCPLDGTGHYWEDPSTKGILDCHAIGDVWRSAARDYLHGYVKSFSGRTKDYLGEPTEEWLKDDGKGAGQSPSFNKTEREREPHIIAGHR